MIREETPVVLPEAVAAFLQQLSSSHRQQARQHSLRELLFRRAFRVFWKLLASIIGGSKFIDDPQALCHPCVNLVREAILSVAIERGI